MWNNQCDIIGNLTRDPEVKTTSGGRSYAKFTVAVNRKTDGKEYTDWVPVTAWGDMAEAFPPEEEALLNEQREDGWTASYFRTLWLDFLKDIQEEQLRRRKMQEEEIIQPELRQLEDSFLGKRATKRKEK